MTIGSIDLWDIKKYMKVSTKEVFLSVLCVCTWIYLGSL